MRQLSINHRTRYGYDTQTQFHEHRLILRPREGHDIRIESSALSISPSHSVQWRRDVYGNSVAIVSFSEPANELVVESAVTIAHYEPDPLPFDLSSYAATFPFQYEARERPDVVPYQLPLFAREDQAISQWLNEFWSPGKVLPTQSLLEDINTAIAGRFSYMRREQPGVQRPSETIASGAGSCRDLATLFIETCRHLGLASRFVSGYLHAPGLPAADGATHAWGEAYLPGAGWRGYDSTIGSAVGGDHIAVAVSRHPEMVPPIAGSFTSSSVTPPTMEVDVAVTLVSA